MALRFGRLPSLLPRLIQPKVPAFQAVRCYANFDRSNPTRMKLSAAQLADEDAVRALHNWHRYFTPDVFPRELCNVSFSRSTGPGGQNVNKLNTKATIRMNVYEIEQKLNWPPAVIDALRAHRDTTKTGDIMMSSERHRTQTMNLEDAWEKLFEFVKESVQLPRVQGLGILNSEAQMERVKVMQKSVVRKWKTKRSEKKEARKGNFKGRSMMDDF